MSTLDEPKTMTVEEFLALPNDGVERWLIRGELRGGHGMTVRNAKHSELTIKLGAKLSIWASTQPLPIPHIVGGEAGFRLPPDDTLVGTDVAVVDDATFHFQTKGGLIKGAPTLAIEILSPSDQVDETEEKIDTYLSSGTLAVWLVNPKRKTVIVHCLSEQPRLFDQTQTIECVELPGFTLKLSELF